MTRTQTHWWPGLALAASTALGCEESERPDAGTWVSPTAGSVGDGDEGGSDEGTQDDGGGEASDSEGGVDEGDSDDGGVDEGGEGTTGELPAGEPFPMWAVGGTVVPGVSLVGGGELYVIDDHDVVSCVAGWDFAAVTPSTDCAACEFAFELTLGEIEIEEEPQAGGCAAWLGLAVEGQVERIGYAAGEVFRYDGRAWTSVGEGEFEAATGEFYAEYELDE
ncbi:MAG: hypothetical protein IAG13_22000 [Deltaproteobacteria bacterium]|nr:hypothetical protein [Nannocystaceae bacterium]